MCASEHTTPRRVRGSSLIEVMVGIVIALLLGLVVMGMAIGFAATQRQAVGSTAATGSGAAALDALRTPVLQAGLGFFGSSSYRCGTLNFSVGSTARWDGSAFTPFTVTRPASGFSDTLELLHASSVYGGADVPLVNASASVASLSSHLPASLGQAVLLSPAAAGGACMVRSITGITPATTSSYEQLSFGASDTDGRYNQASFTTPASYTHGDRIALLGSLSAYRYQVSNRMFQQLDLVSGSTATLAREVMAFRAQYGIAASSGIRTLSSWVEPSGSWAALGSSNIDRVLALRLQLLLRSAQPEKRDAATGACAATVTPPTLITGESFTLSEDDKCYRYRLVTTVIPLRNIATGLQ